MATIDMDRKGGGAVPVSRRAGTLSNTRSTFVSSTIQPFGHNKHRPKTGCGGCALCSGASWVPIEHKVAMERGLTPYQVPSYSIQSFGHNGHWPKIGGLCPFRGVKAASPCNTKSPALRPTSIPSGILVHPAVC